jgi:hypothetical protein
MKQWDIKLAPDFSGPVGSDEMDGIVLQLYKNPELSDKTLQIIASDLSSFDIAYGARSEDVQARAHKLRWCLAEKGAAEAARRWDEWITCTSVPAGNIDKHREKMVMLGGKLRDFKG